ncbi:flippase-like domain-containing protein [Prevotella brunnea]|uniref:Flippase-like domain-containing protein n=1 Tax=Prevotella brunnea TaxID=2508867 RepID=A0A5C8GK08_9BACT|nr:lysylphosphatidylglycerol synthase transmembrane domain-containing protein [Prevotella brunnea]MDR0185425.1 flippase-like domain-containing protein [Prevotella brunnea]TXJ62426.1 flippase-like domain-containing protein [Prevotella brunnea]
MKKKYQNVFFIFGIIVLVVMLTQLDFAEVWQGLRNAGYWFFAVVVLWFFLYIFNTASWYIIIRSQETKDEKNRNIVPFWWLYKVSVSGFALNYATPGGLMGGEPYRIMELSPKIGVERATSSVVLFVMTHIFSHFWFWLLSIPLYILTQDVSVFMIILLSIVGMFCLVAIWFFLSGYKKGLAVRMMRLLGNIPGIRKWAKHYVELHDEQLRNIDEQIAALHNQQPKTFLTVVLSELLCRIFSALEVFFILLVLFPSVNYLNCILIISFTTLFANMLFFMPLQLGGREGGFLMSISGLGLTANAGIFVALIVRIRELIWTAIGLLLIKINQQRRKN